MVINKKKLKELLYYDPEVGGFRWRRPEGNRVSNLRVVSGPCNQKNASMQSDNTTDKVRKK